MQTQSIVFTQANHAELIEEDVRSVGPKDALVQLMYSTISSGTERANLTGELNISIYERFTEAIFPRRGGYSASGIVLQVGAEVTSVKPGDRVVVSEGCHSQFVCVGEDHLHRLERSTMDMRDAALAFIGTFPMAAIRKCHVEIGEPAMVMGLGVLGRIAVQLLRAAGAVPVIAVDPVASRRELALQFGADAALDPNADDFAQRVRQMTHGGVSVAIEVTGVGRALDQALDCMRRFGRIALLGCTRHSDFTIDYYHKVHAPGISLIGAHTQARPRTESSPGLWTHHDDIMALLELCDSGRIDLKAMVEEIHSPTEAPEVYRRLAEEPCFPIVQFDWSRLT